MTTEFTVDQFPAAAPYLKGWQTLPWPARLSTLEQLRSAKTQTSMTTARLASIIRHDPFLTAQLLGYVNSAPRGNFASDVTTIEHALMLVGIEPFFERFGRRMPVERLLEKEPVRLSLMQQRLAICEYAGMVAEELANIRHDSKAEEIGIAALLHDLAEPLLLLTHPQLMTDLKEFALSNRMWFDPVQQQARFGVTYGAMRILLAKQCGLPSLFTDLMTQEESEHPRVLTVQFAVKWAHWLWHGWWSEELHQALHALAAVFMKPADLIWQRLIQLTLRLAHQDNWKNMPSPACWLPMLPGDWPLPKAAPKAHAWPDVAMVDKVIKQLQQKDEDLDVGQVMTILFRGVRLGAGLDRVAFLVQPKGELLLKPRFVVGIPEEHPMHSLQTDLNAPHLFTRLSSKTQGVWYGQHNRATMQSLLPHVVATEPDRDWVAMSLWVHGHPLGILYADGGKHRSQLEEPTYLAFKQLALAAITALEHSAKLR
ncbi:HDOD domain-containing protein [Leeia oryzae]|uniref:HDOD domain-containing protein n=1 Tax=Leeia oryzae TaxID=356662 RepID=UPI00036289A6|nr:HDOD domain-containing protein [Leeia oryzae]